MICIYKFIYIEYVIQFKKENMYLTKLEIIFEPHSLHIIQTSFHVISFFFLTVISVKC